HLGAQSEVSAEVDSLHMLIGDQMPLHLTITTLEGATIEDIDLSGFDKESTLELVRVTPLDSSNVAGLMMYRQDLLMTAFDSGRYYVPQVPVKLAINGAVESFITNEIPIEVRTIETDTTFLAPNKDIIEEPFSWTELIPYAVGLLILAALGGLAWYFLRQQQQEELPEEIPVIRRPAHAIALEKLEALKTAKLWQQGEVKAYQSELTYIVREYLENRFKVQALESTTDEILRELRKVDLPEGSAEKLSNMLQQADMVKFAKADPPLDVHDRLWDEADAFVRQSKSETAFVEEVLEPGKVITGEYTIVSGTQSSRSQAGVSEILDALPGTALKPASLLDRFLAQLINGFIFSILLIVAVGNWFYAGIIVASFAADTSVAGVLMVVWMLAFLLILLGVFYWFFVSMEVNKGNFGRRIVNNRLLSIDGQKLSKGTILGRLILKGILAIPLGLTYWFALFDKDRRTLHDRIMNTMVFKNSGLTNSILLEKKGIQI
ncbi:MAG: RDD family protein, partial [Bacteroidota bacterium]